jgi:hypothetical protein
MGRMESWRPLEGGQPLQLVLFEASARDQTNMVALYDVAPRFCFELATGDTVAERRTKIIEREFAFGSRRYRITLKPTRMKTADGGEVDRYLGEREQIVEEVIRRLAADRGRLMLHEQKNVRFAFTVYELREELRRVKHSYSSTEIVEAIVLLQEVRIMIQDLDGKGSPLLHSAAFPEVGFRRRDDDEAETFVEFNSLVAKAIKQLTFQQVDYDTLMEVRDPVARWLLKRLQIQVATTKCPVQRMTAIDIRRDSGMPEWKKTRDMFRRVHRAVGVLADVGVIDTMEVKNMKVGRRIADVVFTIAVSPDFMAKVHASNRIARQNFEEFARLTNLAEPSDEFVDVGEAEVYRIRAAREVTAAV